MGIKQKNICEIAGKRYMSPSVAGELWNMKYQAVTNACIDGRIIGAYRDSGNRWIIPIDAVKPLDLENIRQILISTLALKNRNSDIAGSWSPDVITVYDYLIEIGMFEPTENLSANTLKNLVLTDKGMRIATEGKKMNIDLMNAGVTIVQVVASVITIWQALPVK